MFLQNKRSLFLHTIWGLQQFLDPYIRDVQTAQWLRTLAILTESPCSVSSTHMEAHYHLYSNFRDSYTLFCSLWAAGTHVVYIHLYRQTLMHKINLKLKKNLKKNHSEF